MRLSNLGQKLLINLSHHVAVKLLNRKQARLTFVGRALLLRLAFLAAEEEAMERRLEAAISAMLLNALVD